MNQALLLALVGIVPTVIATLATYILTSRKNKTDGDQSLSQILLGERKELVGRIKALEDEVAQLKRERNLDLDREAEIEEMDRIIRHDGSTLIRNLLTVLDLAVTRHPDDPELKRPDLAEKSRTIEHVRELRRVAAEAAVRARFTAHGSSA